MRCDLHVHTLHSGMCGIPGLRSLARESYNQPEVVYETLNGLMPAANNRQASCLAQRCGKIALAGSDAHTLASLGNAWTRVPGARSKREFFEGLRTGYGQASGGSGSYVKLTRDVLTIA